MNNDLTQPTPTPHRAPVMDVVRPPVTEVRRVELPDQPTAAATAEQPQELLPAHTKQSRSWGVVIAAVVIAFGLAGLTVFVYRDGKTSKTAPVANSPSPAAQQAASVQTVNDNVQAVDGELASLEENTDFSDSSLSDESLGL